MLPESAFLVPAMGNSEPKNLRHPYNNATVHVVAQTLTCKTLSVTALPLSRKRG